MPFFPNPFKFFGKSSIGYVAGCSAISACTFTFSPVGMTVMLGELVASRKKELFDRVTTTLGVQDAVSNATYLGELLIPMIAFGLPLSPVALGPASPLFNQINLHDYLTYVRLLHLRIYRYYLRLYVCISDGNQKSP
ncbi:MAG: hypothetical protein V8R46_04905 [Eubacterium ramulus]